MQEKAKDRQLIFALSEGKTLVQISSEKKIYERTLEYRLKVLRKRYGCCNTTALVAFFLRHKIIE